MTLTATQYGLLAMDAYNRGYSHNQLDQWIAGSVGDVVSGATVLDSIGDAESNFFGIAYKIGSEVVIAFRGTDDLDPFGEDLVDGALFLTGFLNDQAFAAAQFYSDVTNLSAAEGCTFTLTGHSLGGALAGFVAATTGADATIFASCSFEATAEAYASPNPVSTSQIDHYYIAGEFLEDLRVNGGGVGNANEEIFEGPEADGVALHSIALTVMRTLVDTANDGAAWAAGAESIVAALNNDAVAESVGISSHGILNANDIMESQIAYSAGDGGLYGNSAAESLNHDTIALGHAVEFDLAYVEAIGAVAVQFAASLAVHQVVDHHTTGMLTFDDTNDLLIVDLSGEVWNFGENWDGSDLGAIQEALLSQIISENGIDPEAVGLNISWLAPHGYTFALGTGGFTGVMPELEGEGTQAFVGTAGTDNITGTDGDDLVFGGANNGVGGADTIDGGAGDDIIFGTSGADTLEGGHGNDILFGGGGIDDLTGGEGHDHLIGGTGNDVFTLEGTLEPDGADLAAGGIGDDRFDVFVDEGAYLSHVIYGGSGADSIYIEGDENSVHVTFVTIDGLDENTDLTTLNIEAILSAVPGSIVILNADSNDRLFYNGNEVVGGAYGVIEEHEGDLNALAQNYAGPGDWDLPATTMVNGENYWILYPHDWYEWTDTHTTYGIESSGLEYRGVSQGDSVDLIIHDLSLTEEAHPLLTISGFMNGANGIQLSGNGVRWEQDREWSLYDVSEWDWDGGIYEGPITNIWQDVYYRWRYFDPVEYSLNDTGTEHTESGSNVLGDGFYEDQQAIIVDLAEVLGHYDDFNQETDGTEEADTIFGSGGYDTINPGAGNDTAHGLGGGDTFVDGVGSGDDVYNGGSGDDTVDYSAVPSEVEVDLEEGYATGDDVGTDELDSVEHVITGAGADVIRGNNAENMLIGGDGNDTIEGRGGSDYYLSGGSGDDVYIYARGDGDDVVFEWLGEGAADELHLEDIDLTTDVTFAASRYDLTVVIDESAPAAGDGGTITIPYQFAVHAGDVGVESFEDDNSNVMDLNDVLAALVITTTSPVVGTAGDDTFLGGAGNQDFSGGDGNDFFDGGAGADAFDGGSDMDGVGYRLSAAGIVLDLVNGANNTGDAAGDTLVSIEDVEGTDFADTIIGATGTVGYCGWGGDDDITGAGGDDFISGELGNDTLRGGAGLDYIIGGAGDDIIVGGSDDDYLEGNGGSDTFVFEGGAPGEVDYIADFQTGSGDLLELHGETNNTFASLIAHATQDGEDTLIELDNGTIVLQGVSLGALSASDFLFFP